MPRSSTFHAVESLFALTAFVLMWAGSMRCDFVRFAVASGSSEPMSLKFGSEFAPPASNSDSIRSDDRNSRSRFFFCGQFGTISSGPSSRPSTGPTSSNRATDTPTRPRSIPRGRRPAPSASSRSCWPSSCSSSPSSRSANKASCPRPTWPPRTCSPRSARD
ncbi:hypothetical protein ACHAWF_001067 [Thalassiosira exigua]